MSEQWALHGAICSSASRGTVSVSADATLTPAGAREAARRLIQSADDADAQRGIHSDLPPHERFRAEDIERVGWLVLYWSRIPAQNQDAIYQFIDALDASSVPEACGIVGASITDELAPEDC